MCFCYQLSEARNTLSQHTEMLHELSEWETSQQNRDMLLSGMLSCKISIQEVYSNVNYVKLFVWVWVVQCGTITVPTVMIVFFTLKML